MEIANPAPLGLLCFGLTTAMLMYIDMGWAEAESKALVYGYATWYGGVGQLLVGMLEIIKGNTFGATAFSSYGCFWLGWSLFYVKFQEGALPSPHAFRTGEMLWLSTFGVLTTCFWVITLRKNLCLATVFGLLALTFFLLAGGVHSEAVKRAGGYVGFATALSAAYTAFAELFAHEWGYHVLPGLRPLCATDRKITKKGVEDRITYEQRSNTLLVDFHNLEVCAPEDISIMQSALCSKAAAVGKRMDVIVNYHGFLIANPLMGDYIKMVQDVQRRYYGSVRRFHTDVFGSGDAAWGASSIEAAFLAGHEHEPERRADVFASV